MSSSWPPSSRARAGFGHLDGGRVPAVREANRGARLDVAAGEQLGTACEVVGHDARTRHVVGAGDPAPLFQVRDGQRRVEEGVVDGLGDGGVGVH